MTALFPTLADNERTYTPRDVAAAVRKAGRTKVDESDVRGFLREHSVDLTGEEWQEGYTRHRYSPDLARDLAAGMTAGANGAPALTSKRERTIKPDAPSA